MGNNKMKKIATAAAFVALSSFATNYLYAGDASTIVKITGVSAPMCEISNASTSLDIRLLTDITNGNKIRANLDIPDAKIGHVTCTTPAYVSVKTAKGHLAIGTPSVCKTDILDCIKYRAVVAWGALTQAEVFANGTAGKFGSSVDPAQGEGDVMLTIAISGTENSNLPVQAGEFTDDLTVVIGAPL